MRTSFLIGTTTLLILFAAWQSHRLSASRRTALPEAYAGFTPDTPPALTFVMASLAGFRGIVSEVLWFRVSRLQDEGRFLELVQLADWITRLDPHATEAWVYNAWNLAYNISIMMTRPEDRWRWVQNGIVLLRDDGLRFNPREARLYRELAWLYQNKIGSGLDNAHLTYKLALATAMAPLLTPDGAVDASPENRTRLASLHLDAAQMLALEKRFGPLDWRLAETHALYWATQGLNYATGPERLMCYRSVYQPLILLFLQGRFTGDLAQKQWQTAENLALADTAADFLSESATAYPSRTMTVIHQRFLALAVTRLARAGAPDKARTFYQRLVGSLHTTTPRPSFEAVVNGWEPQDEE